MVHAVWAELSASGEVPFGVSWSGRLMGTFMIIEEGKRSRLEYPGRMLPTWTWILPFFTGQSDTRVSGVSLPRSLHGLPSIYFFHSSCSTKASLWVSRPFLVVKNVENPDSKQLISSQITYQPLYMAWLPETHFSVQTSSESCQNVFHACNTPSECSWPHLRCQTTLCLVTHDLMGWSNHKVIALIALVDVSFCAAKLALVAVVRGPWILHLTLLYTGCLEERCSGLKLHSK